MSAMRIPADVAASIQRTIERGRFEDEADVLRAAMRLLDARERRVEELKASVAEGFAAIERGEGVELTDDLWDQIDREADEMAARGEAPSVDVRP